MEILLSLIILGLAVFGMAIGVIFNNRPLSGSCGNTNEAGECTTCGGGGFKDCEHKPTFLIKTLKNPGSSQS